MNLLKALKTAYSGYNAEYNQASNNRVQIFFRFHQWCNGSSIAAFNAYPEKNMIKTEIFIAGTVPTEHCVCHEEVAICNDSGLLATANCPNVTKKVFRIRYQGIDGTTWDIKELY